MVRQCPRGAKPRGRVPFAPQPRSEAMLVLIQVSSVKTSGGDRGRPARTPAPPPAGRRSGHSTANSIFCKPQSPRRGNRHTALCETLTPRAAPIP
jgi:hypothetical protein